MISLSEPKLYDFTAHLLEDETAVLHYTCRNSNPCRKTVIIKIVRRNKNTKGLPYAFEFIPPLSQEEEYMVKYRRSYPILRIIAAAGVSVQLDFNRNGVYGYGTREEQLAHLFVDVIRVQDPGQVPVLGNEIISANFLGTSIIDTDESTPLLYDPSGESEYTYDGMTFSQPQFQEKLTVKVPAIYGSFNDEGKLSGDTDLSFEARFAYRIIKDARSKQTTVCILATKPVDVRREKLHPELDPQRGHPDRLDYKLYTVTNQYEFERVHERFMKAENIEAFGSSWSIPEKYNDFSNAYLAFEDAAISFIPFAGDLYDIAQFFYGAATGVDFFGRRLTQEDVLLLGIGALLPFAGGGVLKNMDLVRSLGSRSALCPQLAHEIKIPPGEIKAIENVTSLLKQGGQVPPLAVPAILKKIELPVLPSYKLDDMMNAEKKGFIIPGLQEAYAGYYRKNKTKPGVMTPEQWAKKQVKGKPCKILESYLGKEFRKGAAQQPGRFPAVNGTAIMRPASLTAERLKNLTDQVFKNEKKLFERIKKLNIVDGVIPKKLFNTLMGNVGEILAEEYKLRILKSRGDGFELFENVMISVKDSHGNWEPPKLFSDGIIGQVDKKGNFFMTDLFEIKAGKQGGQEATTQIFDWIEDRIQDGAKIYLPGGRIFEYFPADPLTARIINLARAQRHVVTPKGLSHLGMNSGDQVAAAVARTELNLTKQELDFFSDLLRNTKTLELAQTTGELEYLVKKIAEGISKVK